MSIYGEGAYRDAAGRLASPPPRSAAQLAARDYELRDEAGGPLTPAPTPETKPLQPTSVYAVTKRDHEELCLTVGDAYGIPTVALRYFNVYGPRQALSNPYTGVMAIFSARLLNGRAPLVYEDGLPDARLRARLRHRSGEPARARAPRGGGPRLQRRHRASRRACSRWPSASRASSASTGPPDVPGRFRAGDIRHCVADVSRIRRELGYEPRVALADGLRELLDWLRTPDRRGPARAGDARARRAGLAR